jgi:surface antigen
VKTLAVNSGAVKSVTARCVVIGMLAALPGCVTEKVTESVTNHAYSAIHDSGVFQEMAERTGLSDLADNAAARYAETMSTDDMPMDTVGVPLTQLAGGVVTGPHPPDLVKAALTEIAAEHGPAVARRMMVSAFTGGAAMVTGLPSMATGAVAAHDKLVAAQEAQVTVDAAYAAAEATRAETALVPDEDRPLEAAALLRLVDQPAGTRLTWNNPVTGAAGAVALGDAKTGEARPGSASVTCRPVLREYVRESVSRNGLGTICREGSIWYDLS